VRRQRRPGEAVDDGPDGRRALDQSPRGDGLAKPVLEPSLEVAAEGDDDRVPFPRVVDVGEAAVRQLVDDVQREVEVVIGERIDGGLDRRCRARRLGLRRTRRTGERVEQPAAERAPGRREHGTAVVGPEVRSEVRFEECHR